VEDLPSHRRTVDECVRAAGPGCCRRPAVRMFGVGGGFLATPFLIFVAFRRRSRGQPGQSRWSPTRSLPAGPVAARHVDLRMGLVLLLGGHGGLLPPRLAVTYLSGSATSICDLRALRRHAVAIGVLCWSRAPRTYLASPQSGGAARQAAYPLPRAPAAAEAALLQVEALYQRPAADRHRLLHRACSRRSWASARFVLVPGHDLSAGHAHGGGHRHIELPDLLWRPTSPSCRRRPTAPWTSCWRCC